MGAAEERTVRANGVRLRVRAWGDARRPGVVLLHGGSAHSHWWDFVAPRLAERYRVVAPDLRGHGESEHARPPAYAIDDYAADVAALTRALGLERFALVGHSLGAFVAVRLVERGPAAVRSLVVVDGRPRSGQGRAAVVTRLQHLPHPVFTDAEDAVRRFRLLPSGTSARPDVLRHVALAGLQPCPEGGLTLKFDRAAFAHYGGLDMTQAITLVRCPTLFVRGGESAFVDAATLARMAALCPYGESAEIPGAHHHVMLDRPDELTACVGAFLDRTLA